MLRVLLYGNMVDRSAFSESDSCIRTDRVLFVLYVYLSCILELYTRVEFCHLYVYHLSIVTDFLHPRTELLLHVHPKPSAHRPHTLSSEHPKLEAHFMSNFRKECSQIYIPHSTFETRGRLVVLLRTEAGVSELSCSSSTYVLSRTRTRHVFAHFVRSTD